MLGTDHRHWEWLSGNMNTSTYKFTPWQHFRLALFASLFVTCHDILIIATTCSPPVHKQCTKGPFFMWTCSEPDGESFSEQRKLLNTVVASITSDWSFTLSQASSHKGSLALSNKLRILPKVLFTKLLRATFTEELKIQYLIQIATVNTVVCWKATCFCVIEKSHSLQELLLCLTKWHPTET